MPASDWGPSLADQGVGPDDWEPPEDPVLVKAELEIWADFMDKDGHSENGRCPEARWGKRMKLKEFFEFYDAVNEFIKNWSGDPYDFRNMWVLIYLKEDRC